ncbi:Tol-pal system, periplasmic component [Desulfonema limicola]|uniref:Tol-pal system, periplasmic component n=1 Tax=Desulfonema limicola TaxID=45656 RepID=A0A975B8B7_9BACT|nr:Tol-Pal system beta propeller repeat protein TolB [Desulfonema limicola]QTA80507.1 Tol-pal system, periplasmic component [Desulfonema limicola]
MTVYIKKIMMMIFLLMLFPITAFKICFAEDFIDITKFSLRKIPIAIPLINTMSQGQEDISLKTWEMLSNDLDFTGYFKILDKKTFKGTENQQGDDAALNFKNWTGIGAELLITGNAIFKDNLVEIEFRLFDTFKSQLLVGKRYKGWQKDLQQIVRRFCSEVIYSLTGQWGIYESKIAFISTGTGNKEIYICDFDGKNPEPLTRNKSINLAPAWSSDGKWMAYTSFERGRPDLYIKNIYGKMGAVVAKKGINTTPAWMPGKSMLAATLSFSGDQDIYLLTREGKIVKQITNKWGIDTSPAWSPDGKQMAFVSSRSGTPQIYIKSMDTGNIKRITFEGRYNTQPDWSPRGDKITYSAIERGEINIYVVELSSLNSARLTYGSKNNESPTWSPDGSLIAFSSTRRGAAKIYVMTSYGTEQRRLFSMPGEQTSPKWSPRIKNN